MKPINVKMNSWGGRWWYNSTVRRWGSLVVLLKPLKKSDISLLKSIMLAVYLALFPPSIHPLHIYHDNHGQCSKVISKPQICQLFSMAQVYVTIPLSKLIMFAAHLAFFSIHTLLIHYRGHGKCSSSKIITKPQKSTQRMFTPLLPWQVHV